MKIGIPKEIKDKEFRVGLDPRGVEALTSLGHKVIVQKDAGKNIGFLDEDYIKSGAEIAVLQKEVYDSEMIIKVKEPQEEEFLLLKENQILFCYLHLAAEKKLTKALVERNSVAIAFETITDDKNSLPLLMPMSEVAGRISVQAGAFYLQLNNGGKGILLGGVPGTNKAKVVILGGGIAGTEAIKMALGLRADVTVFDINMDRLKELDNIFGSSLKTEYSTKDSLEKILPETDLLIGSVLIPGAKAPRLISKEMVALMEKGTVIVDISIDQGGCIETSRPTTHSDPIYTVNGVIHYCVTNMPGACAKTSTNALTNAILPYAIKIANNGYHKVLKEDKHIRNGLNVFSKKVVNEKVAEALGYEFCSLEKLLK